MGFFSGVSKEPSAFGVGDCEVEERTSSAAATRQASRSTLVSMTQVKLLPCAPPAFRPVGPLSSCVTILPACDSETEKVAARVARVWGDTLATKIFPFPSFPSPLKPLLVLLVLYDIPFVTPFVPSCESHDGCSDGCASSVLRTSVCDCSDTSTASADVTQPEHARQSVRDIWAGGGGFEAAILSSVVTSYAFYQYFSFKEGGGRDR